jgi:RimJ/RimL family protein N-acetyltransferase
MSAIQQPELLDIPDSINAYTIIIRRYGAGDGQSMFAAIDAARDSLSRWLPWLNHHRSAEDSEAYCRRMNAQWALRKDFVLGVWRKDTQQYIGAVGLHNIDWAVPKMVMGYFVCQPHEGHGFGSQAAAAVLEFAFTHLHAVRISASCDTNNERSWRLMERIGFKREATLINDARDHHGDLRDTYLYGLTRATNATSATSAKNLKRESS